MTENLMQVSQRQNIVNILHSLLDNPTAVHLSSQLTSYQGYIFSRSTKPNA